MKTIHELKIQSIHFVDVLAGRKTHEVRFNDRDYQVGDCLNLCEVDGNGEYTGQEMNAEISHVLHGGQFGIENGWCVLSLNNPTPAKAQLVIEWLRDRLDEACLCIESSYSEKKQSGHSISGYPMIVEGSRAIIEEANQYLRTIGKELA